MSKTDSLKRVKSNPTAITKLELLNLGLEEFPNEVFACVNLAELRLSGVLNTDWETPLVLPSAIGALCKLQRLEIQEPFGTLPDSIGTLSQLEALMLEQCSLLEALPSSIGKLSKLKHLVLTECASLRSLPESIGQLSALETLDVWGQEMRLKAIGAEVYGLPHLQRLLLPDSVEKLPAGIGALKNLKELRLSASALRSIAAELPRLTQLEALQVDGELDKLPKEVCSLVNLKELQLYGLRLKQLPAELVQLTKLEKLVVSFNNFDKLLWLVEQLPALKELSYDDVPLPRAEQQAIKALMKLPPSKRGPNSQTKNPSQSKAPQKETKPKPARVIKLGSVVSINASLCMVISDAALARQYGGIEGGEGDELKGSDWHRVLKAIGSKTTVSVPVGGGTAVALALGVGQGTADVFAHDGGLMIIESFSDDDDDLLELAQQPRAKSAKASAEVEITSGAVVLTPSTDGCRDVKAKIKLGKAKECGDDDSGLLIGVNPGRYTLWVEKGRDNARRAHLVPTPAAS